MATVVGTKGNFEGVFVPKQNSKYEVLMPHSVDNCYDGEVIVSVLNTNKKDVVIYENSKLGTFHKMNPGGSQYMVRRLGE